VGWAGVDLKRGRASPAQRPPNRRAPPGERTGFGSMVPGARRRGPVGQNVGIRTYPVSLAMCLAWFPTVD